MYSDMSNRISALSLPNRKLASARASSVLPTPVGPRKMKLPTGRFGFLRPHRAARVLEARARAADRPRDGRDRLVLADDPLVQVGFHAQQLVAFVLVDRR